MAETVQERPDVASEIASGVSALIQQVKAIAQSVTSADADWGGNRFLYQVIANGPMRSGELAELNQSDPSTVSRQVANLVRDGLLERRADPADGRAILLHATEAGLAVHRAHRQTQNEHYAAMLHHWPSADRHTFAVLLSRFVDSFGAYRPTFLAGITEQAAQLRGARRPVDSSSTTAISAERESA